MRKIAVAGLMSALLTAVALGDELKITNPSFEQGTGGYWISKPARAAIDTETSSAGGQSLCLDLPAKTRVSTVQGIAYRPGAVYRVSFDSKSTGGADAPRIELNLMLQGKRPISFWLPPGKTKADFTFTPGDKWERHEFVFGPVPARAQGQEVKKVMLFIDAVGGDQPGKVWIDGLAGELTGADETATAPTATKPTPAAKPAAKSDAKPASKPAAAQSEAKPAATPPAVEGEAVALVNPSFEQGTAGYWVNRPKQVKSAADAATDGSRGLVVELAATGRIDLAQAIPYRPDTVFTVSFDLKSDGGDHPPKVQTAVMLVGAKPLRFWKPGGQSGPIAETVPGTSWQRQTVAFGPVPAQAMGQEVRKVMIFIQFVPTGGPGTVRIDNLQVTAAADVAAKKKSALTLEFPAPVRIYEHPVTVKVRTAAADSETALRVDVTDCRGRKVLTRTAAAPELDVTLERPDYYRLEAKLERRGKTVAAAASSLMITTPLPEDYYSTPHPAFGVWGGLTPELLRIGGAKWTRELFFTLFQKKNFVAQPPTPEQLAKRSPVKVIRCLNVLNPFKRMVPVPEADWPGIIEKVTKELISRRGLVDVWETQNEPMVGENFHGGMKDVVEIITQTSRLVRELNPGVPLAGICINPMSLNQYGQITGYYRNYNMDRLVDGVMLHPYIPNAASPDTSGYVDTLNRLERDLHEITGKDIPLYISEIGYSTKPGGEVTELQQAAYLARVVLLNRRIKSLRACVWHIGLWNEATSARELDYGILRGHPKGSPVREPKPAFAAWATVSRQTYDADYLGEMEFGRGVRVMLFSCRGKPLLAAYSRSGRTQQLKIPLGGDKVLVTDVCGAVRELPVNRGVVDFEVGEAPVYLAGSDPADVKRLAGFKVDFSPEIPAAKPGEKVTVTLNGAPLARPGASLRVETPPGWRTAVTGTGERRQAAITVPAGARPGTSGLFFHLVENGESRSIWRREFKVLPPVELRDVRLEPTNDVLQLRFTPTAPDRTGKVGIKVREDGRPLVAAEVELNRPARLAIPAPAFGRPHHYDAELTLTGGARWETPLPALNRFPVAAATPATASEGWPATSVFDLAAGEYSRHAVRGAFDRPEGKLQLGWDREYLLLRLAIRDRTMIPAPQADSMWQGDSLQIGFSIPPTEMIRPNNDGIQETSFAEFGIMPGTDGQCVSRVWSSTNRTLAELGAPLPGLRATWRREGDITFYRIDIPWRSLNVKAPRAGMPLRFSLLVNDCDYLDGKRYQRHWLEWYSGIANGKEPGLYGDGILTP